MLDVFWGYNGGLTKMKNDASEIAAVEAAAQEPIQTQLSESQLALVGGGVGEVVFT
jgi:hypothetical protein